MDVCLTELFVDEDGSMLEMRSGLEVRHDAPARRVQRSEVLLGAGRFDEDIGIGGRPALAVETRWSRIALDMQHAQARLPCDTLECGVMEA